MGCITSSAEGGRRNWRGVRFEAAFAVLGLVQCARGSSPLGLDDNTKRQAGGIDFADLRFRPQADGAVDDLVVWVEQRKVVAYQAKSGLGRMPRSATSDSDTVSALKQAGRELRDPNGAEVVVLVFGSMSTRLASLARWLAAGADDDGIPRPSDKALNVIASILGYEQADWSKLRPRLRLIKMGSVAEIGAHIDDALSYIYPTPQLRVQVSDALKELVAERSDEAGASLPPVDIEELRSWLSERDLPPILSKEQYGQEIPVLQRTGRRFLDEVQHIRGPLPEIARPEVTQEVIERLEHNDIVLLGSGGAGKSEIQAQIIMEVLAEGWLPIVIRREDLGYGAPDLSDLLGVGGRVGLADVIRQLIERDEPEQILLVIDGLDEMYRTSGAAAGQKAAELYRVLHRLRERNATREHLRILLSCRSYDWERLHDSSIGRAFESFEVPSLTREKMVAGAQTTAPGSGGSDIFQRFVAALPQHLVPIVLVRPILLRLAYELWLGRTDDASRRLSSTSLLTDVISDITLWRAYYNECVCSSDHGLVASTPSGEVKECHHDMALAHIDEHVFVLSVPAEPLERSYPRAFPWLRSLEVAVLEPAFLERSVHFFHASYADFALALALAQERERCIEVARSPDLAIMLFPVWPYVTRFWEQPQRAIARTRKIFSEPNVAFLAQQGILNGWLDRDGLDEQSASALIVELLSIQNDDRPLLEHLFEALRERVNTRKSLDATALWLRALRPHTSKLDVPSLDAAMRLFNAWAESVPDGLRADLALGGALGWEGMQRAQQLAATPHQFDNARVLARHAATAISYAMSVATSADAARLSELPTEPDAWPETAGAQNAAWLAADVRDELVNTAALLCMNQASPAETSSFLCRIMASLTGEDGHAPMYRPQQTEYLNLQFSLQDMWRQSWRNAAGALPELFQAGGAEYLQVSVVSWMVCGYVERAHYHESYPVEVEGDYWLHDESHHWWHNGHSLESHRKAVYAGREYIDTQLQQGNAEPARRFRDLIYEVKWIGLVARFVETVSKSLQRAELDETVRHEVASMAAELLLRPRSFFAGELRASAGLALRPIVEFLDAQQAEALWAQIRELQALDRIVAQPLPERPDMESVRCEHEEHLAKLHRRREEGDHAQNDPFGATQASIECFQKIYTPERMFGVRQRNYDEQKKHKEAAEAGAVPWSHPDIQYVLRILEAFYIHGQEHLIPGDLQALYSAALRELGKDEMPSFTRRTEISEPPVFSGPERRESTEPRAKFCDEAERLESERLNRQEPIPEHERVRICQRIEETRDMVGVDEPSPGIPPVVNCWEEPDARSQQPFPKRAWLKCIVTYLDGLPQDASHALSTATVDAIVHLARDVDPVDTKPVESFLRPNVRGLAAECLALLLAQVHDGEHPLVTAFTELLKDPSPEVRRSIWRRAWRVIQARADLYEPLVGAFVQETDSYLLDFYGDAMLLARGRDAIPVADRIIAPMLERLFMTTDAPFIVTTEEQRGRTGITPILAQRAIGFIYYGDAPHTYERLPRLLRARAWEVIDHRIGWFITEAALEVLTKHDVKDDWPVVLLETLEKRPALTLEARDAVDDAAIGQEIQAQRAILGTLGSALMGDLRLWELAIDFSRYPRESRKERLSAGFLRFEPRIRSLWRRLVQAWVQSDLHAYAQKLILDAVRVQRILARESAADAAHAICAWDVGDAVSRWEQNLQTELADLLEALLLRPPGELDSKSRTELAKLLNSLAQRNPRAQAVVALLAIQVRRS